MSIFSDCWDNMTKAARKRLLKKTTGGRAAIPRHLDDLARTELIDFSDNMTRQIENLMGKMGAKCF